MYKEINTNEFKEKFLNNRDSLEIIDVRENFEFNQLRIKGSKLIPISNLGNKLNEINWDKEVIIICRSGARSGYITNILNSKGFDSKNLAGGIEILKLNCEECMKQGDINKDYFE
ncbi:MAG: rhodanese-like domain-containing protein [Candidatus Gracilibacteria bacterium]